jgi:hypothetical protein
MQISKYSSKINFVIVKIITLYLLIDLEMFLFCYSCNCTARAEHMASMHGAITPCDWFSKWYKKCHFNIFRKTGNLSKIQNKCARYYKK